MWSPQETISGTRVTVHLEWKGVGVCNMASVPGQVPYSRMQGLQTSCMRGEVSEALTCREKGDWTSAAEKQKQPGFGNTVRQGHVTLHCGAGEDSGARGRRLGGSLGQRSCAERSWVGIKRHLLDYLCRRGPTEHCSWVSWVKNSHSSTKGFMFAYI